MILNNQHENSDIKTRLIDNMDEGSGAGSGSSQAGASGSISVAQPGFQNSKGCC
ncbi:uncharacterized protein VP01_4350g3 [Puccinia sorghi]|uniref:Uncharacterized protein n=1 Tax=Puccinia sorghi TaxID=27349 RepID=A0A0L6UPU7_9BASI|nr:uncharacterized protein VP01_4350g3 [Puccinia sorghi]